MAARTEEDVHISTGPSGNAQRAIWKPLNRGYEAFPEVFAGYARDGVAPYNPPLSRGLQAFLSEPPISIFQSVGSKPLCLIQGISCPWNGTSLREFMSRACASEPAIHAIDILDVAAVAHFTGYDLPHLSFSVADASRLTHWEDGSVNVLVQDHLLNCAPHGIREAIVSEAARVLHPDGVWILNFSTEPVLANPEVLSVTEAGRLLGRPLSDAVYCLREAAASEKRLAMHASQMLGKLIVNDSTGDLTLITPPHGNFEFYFRRSELDRLLTRYGCRVVYESCEYGLDQHGNQYRRCRTLVRHAQ
jgi:hypothetical protein